LFDDDFPSPRKVPMVSLVKETSPHYITSDEVVAALVAVHYYCKVSEDLSES
jgi:hypothetical protein